MIDLVEFAKLPRPLQHPDEWKVFIGFAESYLRCRGVNNPVVVEVGTDQNKQKAFYEKFLNAEHIGIDINEKLKPDIAGDSRSEAVMSELKNRLAGRQIDLLFIDGQHYYDNVKSDYKMYAPLTKHIVALHDINTVDVGVKILWNELKAEHSMLTVDIIGYGTTMGIGLILKSV